MMIVIMSMITMTTLFLFLKHPLSMTIVLIIQTLMISLLTDMMMSTFIMYIIMIIMISGMLVLFIYMSSVASNEKFKMLMITPIILIMTFILLLYFNKEKTENTVSNMMNSKESLTMIKIFNYPMSILTLFTVMYLFLTMITISNIVNMFKGPLRMKIYE
nr:NADH dehydrogenase subunit 6 [Chelurotropella siamensis]